MNDSWLKKSLSFIGSTAVAFSMNSGLSLCCPGKEDCKGKKLVYYKSNDKEVDSCPSCAEKYNSEVLECLRVQIGTYGDDYQNLDHGTFLYSLCTYLKKKFWNYKYNGVLKFLSNNLNPKLKFEIEHVDLLLNVAGTKIDNAIDSLLTSQGCGFYRNEEIIQIIDNLLKSQQKSE